jgi:hypothetical protein
MAVEPACEDVDERRDVAAKTDAAAGLLEMLAAHAAELRIVPDEIRELAPLLYQIAAREAVHLLLERRRAKQLAEDGARIVEAQGLIEIRRDQVMPGRRGDGRHDVPRFRGVSATAAALTLIYQQARTRIADWWSGRQSPRVVICQ